MVCRNIVTRFRTCTPTVVTGYALLLHVHTYFYEVPWCDIIDMCLSRQLIFGFAFVVNQFAGITVQPLIGAGYGFFSVKVFYRIAQCIETDRLVCINSQSFTAFLFRVNQRVSVWCPFSCGRTYGKYIWSAVVLYRSINVPALRSI